MKIAVLEPLGISDDSLRGLLAKATDGHEVEVVTNALGIFITSSSYLLFLSTRL